MRRILRICLLNLSLCAGVLILGQSASAVGDVSLTGRFRMIEQLCIVPNQVPEKIAPGFPGTKEEWLLTFIGPTDYSFLAEYRGILGDNCRLESEGRYSLQENGDGRLSSVRLTPNKNSLRRAGSFEAPCRVLTFEKTLNYEARMEPAPTGSPRGTAGPRPDRLRLRANDILGRCTNPKAKMEILFEPEDLRSTGLEPAMN